MEKTLTTQFIDHRIGAVTIETIPLFRVWYLRVATKSDEPRSIQYVLSEQECTVELPVFRLCRGRGTTLAGPFESYVGAIRYLRQCVDGMPPATLTIQDEVRRPVVRQCIQHLTTTWCDEEIRRHGGGHHEPMRLANVIPRRGPQSTRYSAPDCSERAAAISEFGRNPDCSTVEFCIGPEGQDSTNLPARRNGVEVYTARHTQDDWRRVW